MKAGAIILAGGKSSRMGTNKALLTIDGKTNIERIRDELGAVFDNILVVANDRDSYQFLDVPIFQDQYPGKGPLAGIHAGLSVSDFTVNFIVACDMPFISAKLATVLVNKSEGYDAVIPVIKGRQHPLFAVYKKSIMQDIQLRLENEDLRIRDLLNKLNVRYVTEDELREHGVAELERVFFNMNHPDEYENARKWAETNQ